jgi:excisionase family DNA binding protein
MNAREVAAFLQAHVETIRRLARRREIPAFKIGNDWRFHRESLLRCLTEQAGKGSPGKVLVIDDDPGVVWSLARKIEKMGHRALEATSGVQGLEFSAHHSPDLILLDLKMPGMDGVEFLRQLRPKDPDVPVVVVTGYPDSDLVHQALSHAPIMMLAKPVEPLQLARTIQAVVGNPRPAAHVGSRV